MDFLLYPNTSHTPPPPPPGVNDKPRIAIVMINSEGVPKYGHHAALNNYLYASYNNYDFIVEKQPQDMTQKWTWDAENQYVMVWYKAELIKRHLKNYHYILYIDSDAFFYNFNYKIEDVLVDYINKNNLCMLFQEDKWQQSIAIQQNDPTSSEICAGLIFVKNCPESFSILDLWSRAPYVDENCFKYRHVHAREQDCIIYLRQRYNLEKYIDVYPCIRGMFGQYDSKWIVHLGAISEKERSSVLCGVFSTNYQKFFCDGWG